MDRNFFLPIAVAAGVHSLLFLSGTKTDIPPTTPASQDASGLREIVLPPIEPDAPEAPEPGEKAPSEPPPPTRPNIPTINFDPTDFTEEIKADDLIPRPPAPDTSHIDRDWPGAVEHAARGPRSKLIPCDMLDNRPMARFQPAPLYPHELKPSRADGSATVSFSVNVSGEVFNAVVNCSSHSRFGEEALRAVKRWRFEPGMKDGKRIAFRMVQTFTFTLSE